MHSVLRVEGLDCMVLGQFMMGVASVGRQLLRSVGGFFGLTEASQRGNENVIGWQEFNERNLEVDVGYLWPAI